MKGGNGLDTLIQGAAALGFLLLALSLIGSERDYAIIWMIVALIAMAYFALGAVDSALGGDG